MPWGELGLNALALLVYPGAAATLALGLAAETVASRVMTGSWLAFTAPSPGLRRVLPRQAGARAPRRAELEMVLTPLAGAVALFALLAACQLAAPFSPVGAAQRNLLVAAVALASAAWLVWVAEWNRDRQEPPHEICDFTGTPGEPVLMLLAQAGWLVALLAPAVALQTLRPQVLGAVVLPAQIVLKVLAGALFLLCLPVLLRLLDETGAARFARLRDNPVRLLLWLPQCGLFASVFFPTGDDRFGLVRFLAATLGAAAAGIALTAAANRWALAAPRRIYFRLAPTLLLLVLILAAGIAVYPQGL